MTLKTLKDLQNYDIWENVLEKTKYQTEILLESDIKKEAIKWIKSKHCMNFRTTWDSDLFSNAYEAMGAMKILKYFFNITEEELSLTIW